VNTSQLDLGPLGMDRGAHLLVKNALGKLRPGDELEVSGTCRNLNLHLATWCRTQGHRFDASRRSIVRGDADLSRWAGAEQAGHPQNSDDAVSQAPPLRWGLAARGATVEAGAPEFDFSLTDKDTVWTEEAGKLYKMAAAAQWDPETAIDWSAPMEHPEYVEDAVVQIMTYLIENETAALIVPARFLARIHPHFREVMQLLAIQAADEARHIEVFTRRALLHRDTLGFSTAGGQASLKTLLDEPDFAMASFLLSVLGEGSFLSLLWFLRDNAPDPVTRQVTTLSAQDEARHVAFGLAHLERHARMDPALVGKLTQTIEQRHDALAQTTGLNEEVFDALVLLAAGSWELDDIAAGWRKVLELKDHMHNGRVKRLKRLGFSIKDAEHFSALHTRNFM
jgi:hypothetical protein